MAISTQDIKQLRDATGCGMMDCKRALEESSGNVDSAKEYLRKKGIAKAEKKSGRTTGEGAIGHYIHSNGKIGVLVEIRSETDFVARSDDFQQLIKDVAMHIAAMNPLAVNEESFPKVVLARERRIASESDEVLKKPEKIRPKIVEGKVKKFIKENALLNQAFVKDQNITVDDRVKETAGKVGENIKVVRFVRIELGSETASVVE
ncbi:MAG: translation elongation factor Ts [Planctomycetota bacterium]|nr:MAG: translation elongation factor Ts [Planctomycetota bacterium]